MTKLMLTVAIVLLQMFRLTAQYNWNLLEQSPQNGQKQDDVFFLNPMLGWSVNGSGRIFKTTDGGQTWAKALEQQGTYFRCIGFIDSLHGFAGNIGTGYFPNVSDTIPLYRTADGGGSWQPVTAITGDQPKGLCAIQVVNPQVIYAGGRVGSPTHLIKSTDGGATWTSQSLAAHIAMVTDLYFSSPDTGFVFGGTSDNIQIAHAKILRTTDGGQSWTSVYESTRPFEIILQTQGQNIAYGIGVRIYKMTQTLNTADEEHYEPARLLRAYPNPVSNYLTVEYYLEDPAVITFQLTDSLGKLVLETAPAAQQAFRQTETLATGYLPPGTYFLTMRAGKQQLAQTTIVIQQKP